MVFSEIALNMSRVNYENLRATNNEHKEKSELLSPGHLKTQNERYRNQNQSNICDDICNCRCDIQAVTVDAVALCDRRVPSPCNRIACKDQGEDNSYAVSTNNC